MSPKTTAASGRSRSSASAIPGQHRVDVARVRLQPVGGLGQPELLEEHVRELAVVVLARVDDDLLDAGLAQRDRQRTRLDELRAVADDGEHLHGVSVGRRSREGGVPLLESLDPRAGGQRRTGVSTGASRSSCDELVAAGRSGAGDRRRDGLHRELPTLEGRTRHNGRHRPRQAAGHRRQHRATTTFPRHTTRSSRSRSSSTCRTVTSRHVLGKLDDRGGAPRLPEPAAQSEARGVVRREAAEGEGEVVPVEGEPGQDRRAVPRVGDRPRRDHYWLAGAGARPCGVCDCAPRRGVRPAVLRARAPASPP